MRLWLSVIMLFSAVTLSAAGRRDTADLNRHYHLMLTSTGADTTEYISLARKTISLAEELGHPEIATHTYMLLAIYLKANIGAARAERELAPLKALTDKHKLPRNDFFTAWQNIIVQYYAESNTLYARNEFSKMHEMATQLNDEYGLACAYTALGTISEYDYDTAKKNFEQALELAHNSGLHDKDFFIIYRMADEAYKNGHYEEVLEYAGQLLSLKEPPPNVESYSAYLNLITHLMLDNREKSDSSYAIIKQQWDTQTGIPPYFTDRYATALAAYQCKYGNPETAQKYLPSIQDEKNRSQIEILYYKSKGDWHNAYEEMKHYFIIEKKLMKASRKAEAGSSSAFYKNKELERQTRELEIQNSKERIAMIAFTLALIAAVASYVSITTRRHNRRLRAERAKAVHLNEMKTTFINNLTHEVRTPLNSIVGFNDMLNNSGVNFSEDERREMLLQINGMANQLTTLLDNVIFMSRIDGNDIKPVITNVPVAEALAEAFAATADAVTENVSFDVEQAFASTASVQADRELLIHAFKAVFENAAKFTPEGVVGVSVTQSSTEPCRVQIAITNPSPIIPAAAAEQIFERFEKLGRFEPGFGLGLSITRDILQLMGGNIELDTHYPNGNRFVITV